MKIKILDKKNINTLLKEAAGQWNVYVPQKNLGGDIWIEPLPKDRVALEESLENIVLEGSDTLVSAKDIFFPQLETIFKFNEGHIKETVESSPKLLFGIKACDLKGMLFSDAFYKRNFEDKYYLSRSNDRLIVVMGCIKPPRATCFCASAKTGPFAREGYDVQLIDAKDSYFVEIGSKKGEAFIAQFKKYFKDSLKDNQSAISRIKSDAEKSVELKVDFDKAVALMSKDAFVPEENYKRIGERCIYCGACLYVCPTCTCFNSFDNSRGASGERLRNWDGCIFEGYTRETSGHNPRKEKWQRTSRRYEHKLKYDYKTTGASGCVGCGRCLSSCPVNIGISKFIQEITEDKRIL
ncbi:MAG: 4Fe-4S dicluster domain-containing protein [Candidatus Omnitrophota bacterium]